MNPYWERYGVFFFYMWYKGTVYKYSDEFEDTKGVITIHQPDEDKQHKSQAEKDKQRSTKHHTEH
jgi:uncharacterized protein involved in tellurium resistance